MENGYFLRPIVACALLAGAVHGQSLQWSAGFANSGANLGASEVCVFDAGLGERLYVASIDQFAYPTTHMIRRHDGLVWDDFHADLDGRVLASCVWDDGTGAALYMAGEFAHIGGTTAARIARFDGTSFTPLGTGIVGSVDALVAHDDGSGAALYAVGHVVSAGGSPSNGIARWNGTSWIPITQLSGLPTDAVSFDDGSGPALYVSGDLLGPSATAPNVAKWNGTSWSYMPFLENGFGTAVCVHDDGTGPALYAANEFSTGSSQVVRWNGAFWTTVGPVFNGTVHDLQSTGVGGGNLVAVGQFTTIGGVSMRAAARWNGTQWSAISNTLTPGSCNPMAYSIANFHPAGGPARLVLAGCFGGSTPGATHGPFVWDGQRISSLYAGHGLNSQVSDQLVYDDGSGEALYVVGSFTRADDVQVHNVARWNGAAWSALGTGIGNGLNAIVAHDDGSGTQLYVGGFAGVRRWNGVSWSAVGTGIDGVLDMVIHDDGSGARLYVALQTFDLQVDDYVNKVMRWDGATWTQVGGLFNELILALAVHDAGAGPRLYAGGAFTSAGPSVATHVAEWNGTAWISLGGSGTDGPVASLMSWNDGSGPALLLGGAFTQSGFVPTASVARWQNGVWSALGAGLGPTVRSFGVFDDGSGPALYAGGSFTVGTPGGTAKRIARWNGTDWSPLGSGVEGGGAEVLSLSTFRSSWTSSPVLTVAGYFGRAGGEISAHFAQWGGSHDGIAACFGDGQLAACPCGNPSAVGAGTGCRNGTGVGSRLRSDGEASVTADTFTLIGTDMPNTSYLTYFQGTAVAGLGAGVPFDDGLRCAAGSTIRIASLQNQNGSSIVPNPQQPTPISVRGFMPPVGGTRVYQARHRDIAGPCGTFANLTNAIIVTWRP